MKTNVTHHSSPRSLHCRTGFTVLLVLTALNGWAAPFGSAFTYQGRLNFSGAPAADGLYDFRFTLHDAATLGSPVGSVVPVNAVPVTNGLFTVPLDFLTTPFTSGEARWLQLQVNINGITPLVTLNPRQRITPNPQALYAGSATTATTATTASSVAAGAVTSSGLAPGSVGATAIADGAITSADLSASLLNTTFWKLTGNDVIPGQFIGSTNNQPLELKVGGARALRLEPRGVGLAPNVLGGYSENTAGSFFGAAIAGGGTSGAINSADGNYSFIGAGIGGHTANSAFVGAGAYNSALGTSSLVGSGIANTNRGDFAAIVAGSSNAITALADHAFIGGGQGNTANNTHATVGGGEANRSTSWATVGGGRVNQADGAYATVGGGRGNVSGGIYATVPGGYFNLAAGQSSFAAGTQARANHQGSFVWADSLGGPFDSTTNNQFLIRAAGNVGINKINPAVALDIDGGVRARGGPPGPFGVNNNGYAFSGNGGDEDGGMFSSANGRVEFYGNSLERMRITETGNVGIGTTAPVSALQVIGTVTATSFSGNGAGLTSLTAANLTGPIADARLSANVALRAGGNTFTGDQVISGGNLSLSDASTSLIFPATSGPNTPMIHLFASGTGNADRMVLSHSPEFPNWGLQYQDPADQFNFLSGGSPVMTVALGTRKVGIGTEAPEQQLSVAAGLNIDQNGANSGTVANALTFGSFSGEGIASRRTSGANQYGLDFYTGAQNRMSILNFNGNVGIGTTSPSTKLQVSGTVTANSDASEGFYVAGASAGYALEDRVTGAAGRWVMYAADGTLALWRGDNQMTVDQSGNLRTAGSASVCALTIRGGCDLAEPFQMSGKDLPKGAVVVIDEANPGQLKLSESAYDTRVAGIISGANGVNPGISLHQEGVMEGGQNVALSGRVYVQADTVGGAIKPGDLLTTSATPGHAMKVGEHGKAQGAILGKAMTALAEGKGMVLVLVTLQ
jgi:hypothetical protein